MIIPTEDLQYVTSLEEIVSGGVLVAITLAMHGAGMISTIRSNNALKTRFGHNESFARGMSILILASWIIIVVHLVEVIVWAGFFAWRGAMPSLSLAYYLALMDYTTLGCEFNLPLRWRLLEGMIAMAGLMTFAWSTGVLLTLAQEFQDQQLQSMRRRREKPSHQPASSPSHGSGGAEYTQTPT